MEKKQYKTLYQPVSDEAMERLVRVMNDTPTIVKLANADWEITALKPAVQNLIAQEACDINKVEKASFEDVCKCFAQNLPSVVRIITLALLNDKERIEKDYQRVYDTIMWESEIKDWGTLLIQVLQLIDVGFFFSDYRIDTDVPPDVFSKEDDDGRSKEIISRTEWGQMIDFLRANPYVSKEEYLWQWTIPQVKLASLDYSHVEHLSEEQAKAEKNRKNAVRIDNVMDLVNDLGIPVFNTK